jgi:hypothetical protein
LSVHIFLLISNLQASKVAEAINVPLILLLDKRLIIPSELLFRDVEAILAEIVSMAVLI